MEWAAWVAWEEWAAWECNPRILILKIQKRQRNKSLWRFFLFSIYKYLIDRFKIVAVKDMRKMSNIVENLIKRYVRNRV